MIRWLAAGAVTLLAAAVLAVVLVGAEDVEHVFKSEATPYRAPHGAWVRSVPGKRAQIWAVGDSEAGTSRSVAALIERSDADRVLYLGDVYPSGTRSDFEAWDRVWGRLVPRMAPTPGNHDWPEAGEGYDPYWTAATGDPPPTNYRFSAGRWQILSFNSEHDEQAAQARWAEEQMSGRGTCRIAFWHRPRWSAGPHGDDEAVDGLWRAVRGGVAAVISGHEHNMQRLAARSGVVQFISGAGGYSHTMPTESDPRPPFADGTHDGALRLKLSRGRARWAFVASTGVVLDAGSLQCHPARRPGP